MSENDPTPSKQTSSIPLKKETVRVTLKAADAPPAAPSAAIPVVRPPTPTAPPVPTAPPMASAPAAPTAPGAPRPAPAATIPLKTAGAPIPRPAPTIALKTGPAAPSSPATRPSLPGAPAGGSTISLPKATVQLSPPSGPMATGFGGGLSTLSADEEEEAEEGALPGILALVACLVAFAALYFQYDILSARANATDNPNKGELVTELMK